MRKATLLIQLFAAAVPVLAIVVGASLHEINAQESGLQVEAGPNVAVVAGQDIPLGAQVTGGDGVKCTWTITEPVARFSTEDTNRVMGEGCDVTIPGAFTAERIGLWTLTVTVTDAAGNIATDTVSIRVAPDTMNSLILGYLVIFAIGGLFIGSMAWRTRELRKQAALLDALSEETETPA